MDEKTKLDEKEQRIKDLVEQLIDLGPEAAMTGLEVLGQRLGIPVDVEQAQSDAEGEPQARQADSEAMAAEVQAARRGRIRPGSR